MSSLKKNVIYSSILAISNYIFPLIVYPYISRVLGVTNVGICGFVDGIIQYYCNFSMMGISYLAIREISSKKGNMQELSRAFSSLITLNSISTIIVFILLILSIIFIPTFHRYTTLLIAGSVKLLFNTLLIEWFYQGMEDFKYITKRTIIIKICYAISVFIFVKASKDYDIYFYLTCLVTIINALVNIIHSRKYVRFSFKGINIRPYIKPFITLGLYSLLVTMYTTFNTIYLGFVSNDDQVGYYTTAIKVHNIILAIFTAFSSAIMPRIANLLSEGDLEGFKSLYSKSIDILFSFSFPLMAVCIIYADQIVHWISGAGYEQAIPIMRIVLPMIFVVGYEQILIIQMLTPMKKDRYILFNSFGGAVICTITNILIVPHLQGIGSAISWILSEITVMTMAQYFVNRFTGLEFPFRQLLCYLMASLPIGFILILLHIWNPLGNFTLFAAGVLGVIYYCIFDIKIIKKDVVYNLYQKIVLRIKTV